MTRENPGNCLVIYSDRSYLKYAEVLIADIRASAPGADFDIYLCSFDELDISAELRASGVIFRRFDADRIARLAPEGDRLPLISYLRLFILDDLPASYKRAVLLDVDTIALGDVSALFGLDLRGRALGAARIKRQVVAPGREMRDFSGAADPAAPYFNAGVLVVDVSRWRAARVPQAAEALLRRGGAPLEFMDQSILNIVFREDWTEISPVWNWPFFGRIKGHEPRIVHFIGRLKWWSPMAAGPWRRAAAARARRVKGACRPGPAARLRALELLAGRLLFFRRHRRRVARHLEGFPDARSTRLPHLPRPPRQEAGTRPAR